MSSLTRMLSVLDLFSEEKHLMDVDEIASQLELSKPTAYRYVRELTNVGILTKVATQYGLGPRIIQLDHQMQQCDQLIHVGRPIADELAEITNSNILLTSVYGSETINVYQATGDKSVNPSFGRGHKMPVGRGATSRIVLAFTKRDKLKRLYQQHQENPGILEIGDQWSSFQRKMNEIRRRGYELSRGELDAKLVGIAAPVLDGDGYAYAALTIVMSKRKAKLYDWQALADHLVEQAGRISQTMLRAAPQNRRT